jgi:flagellar basal-body rod protein FlgF
MSPINGMTSASQALRYWEQRQEVTANNLANVSTDGFKAERSFAQMLDGAPVMGTHIDRKVGTLRTTGQATDVALGNDSFLVVNTAQGERWSRGGALHVDTDGFLADTNGNRVLGKKGAIKTGDSAFTVSKQGVVSVGNQVVDEMRVETASSGRTLEHQGNSLLIPPDVRTSVAAGDRDVQQGVIEDSNVDSLGSMVDMLGVQRAYAAVEKSISVLDHVRETATSELGKPVA